MSFFGTIFRVATWGESHGKAIGVVIDGVPPGLPVNKDEIWRELALRRPGRRFTSPRNEADEPEILSGVFNGYTTGTPISIVIWNKDVISKYYEEIKRTPRPGHADLAYIRKYGFEHWDYRGGGRASGRETASRVAAGAIAKKLLACLGICVFGSVVRIGGLEIRGIGSVEDGRKARASPYRVVEGDEMVERVLKDALSESESVGGIVEVRTFNLPAGLGEPVFDKLKADLAKALMSIPAATAFEVGAGFKVADMKGSEVRDPIVLRDGFTVEDRTSGGMLGGISVGDIRVKVAFKPTTSIIKPQKSVDVITLEEREVSVKGRHDPALVIRAVSVAEAMVAIVLADHLLRSRYLPPFIDPAKARYAEETFKRCYSF